MLRVDFSACHPRFLPPGQSSFLGLRCGSASWEGGKFAATKQCEQSVQNESREDNPQAPRETNTKISKYKGAWTTHLSCFTMFKESEDAEVHQVPLPAQGEVSVHSQSHSDSSQAVPWTCRYRREGEFFAQDRKCRRDLGGQRAGTDEAPRACAKPWLSPV